MLLKDLKINEEGVVKDISNEQGIKRRLNNLGLKKGVKVRIIGFSPFLDPIEIKFNNMFVAISKSVADKIEVF